MVSVYTFTELGGDHSRNEDAFAAFLHPSDDAAHVCFLADGQGGRSGGGRASELACLKGVELTKAFKPADLTNPSRWLDVLKKVDASVGADGQAGFTTLVGLGIRGDRVVGVSSGDSAALLLTGSQTHVLTDRQYKNPPVGSGSAIGTTFEANLIAPWRLLVMTDGVWKYAGWDRIRESAPRHRGEEMIAELKRAATPPRISRLQDDFTVVLFESNS